MTWAKVDDRFHSHRKTREAWHASHASIGLHFLAMSYSAGQMTDGWIECGFVNEKLPNRRERDRAVSALEAAGLWERHESGWQIHDWLDYNPSRAEILAKRRKDSERKARGFQADSKRDSARNPGRVQTESRQSPDGIQAPSAAPDPTRPIKPPPAPPSGGRGRDRARSVDEVATWAAEHFPGADPLAVGSCLSWARTHGLHSPSPGELSQYAQQRGAIWADMLGLSPPDPEVSP